MPRYYFDLSNGHRVKDHAGLDCTGEEDAKRKAEMIAGDIGREAESLPKKHLTVVDDTGRDIYEAAITKNNARMND